MVKKAVIEIFLSIKFLVIFKKDILLVPLLGAAVYFLQSIMNTDFSIQWIGDFNVWGTSFLSSAFLFMLFDLTLSRIPFFKRYNKITLVLSFFVSTFVGESISYTLKNNIQWWHWMAYFLMSIVSFGALLIFLGIGASLGNDKAGAELEKTVNEYRQRIKEIPKKDRDAFIQMSEKALALDDSLFAFVTMFDSKEQIKAMKEDLYKIY